MLIRREGNIPNPADPDHGRTLDLNSSINTFGTGFAGLEVVDFDSRPGLTFRRMSMPDIATRRGDDGETSLGSGDRVDKSDPRIEAVGEIDCALAALGRGYQWFDACAAAEAAGWRVRLRELHVRSFQLMGELAVAEAGKDRFLTRYGGVDDKDLERLEAFYADVMAALNRRGETLSDWRIYGDGGPASAEFFFIRGCFRKAEIQVCKLRAGGFSVRPVILAFLNRLSDLLFYLAVFFEKPSGEEWGLSPKNRRGSPE